MDFDLVEETLAFQAMQQHYRGAQEAADERPWDDELAESARIVEIDLLKAKARMEIAWLAATMKTSSE